MEKIELKAKLLLTLRSKQDWINYVPDCLPDKVVAHEQRVFVDNQGNVLALGEDFAAAEKLKTYPVKVYKLIRVIEN